MGSLNSIGHNKVPTVSKYLANLDKEKQERDRRLDELKQNQSNPRVGDAVPHVNEGKKEEGPRKTVTDPTTGHEVQIEDVNKEFVKAAKDPKVYPIFATSTYMLTFFLPSSLCPTLIWAKKP